MNEHKKPKSKYHGNKNSTIFNFMPYLNKEVTVSLVGGRTVTGVVKSFDIYTNLVLDNVIEYINEKFKRELGIVIIKGTMVFIIFIFFRSSQ